MSAANKPQIFRRIGAIICFLVAVAFFAAAGTSLVLRLQWISRIQIIGTGLSISLAIIALWLMVTLIFGRLYCSTVCPLGVMMDIVAWFPRSRRSRPSRWDYRYTTPRNILRYGWMLLVMLLAAAGLTMVVAALLPFTAFGSFISSIFNPLAASALSRPFLPASAATVAISALTFLVVAFVAAFRGRSLCNSFCPVGAALSLPAARSLYVIDINTDLCTACGLCERSCKAHCIDLRDHTVDTSRCVVCFDCLASCSPGAISYTRNRHRLSMPLMRSISPQTSAGMAASDAALKIDSSSISPKHSDNETISRPS